MSANTKFNVSPLTLNYSAVCHSTINICLLPSGRLRFDRIKRNISFANKMQFGDRSNQCKW